MLSQLTDKGCETAESKLRDDAIRQRKGEGTRKNTRLAFGTSVKRHEPSSIRKHCGCCGTLPSVCPSCSPAVRSTDFRNNNRQARNTPPPPCRRLIVASSAPPLRRLSSPPLFTWDQRTDLMVNFNLFISFCL